MKGLYYRYSLEWSPDVVILWILIGMVSRRLNEYPYQMDPLRNVIFIIVFRHKTNRTEPYLSVPSCGKSI